jgi:Protein of unknown function (DUF2786)
VTTDDIVKRIRKLMRLAENAAATEAEAASALERANALLIRHNLTMDRVAVSVGDKPAVTEQRVRTGWAGNWRGSLLGILARHNLSSPIISREGRVDTIFVVGRPANVRATHAMYDWIAVQLERFAQDEWRTFDKEQREAVAALAGTPWCTDCEDWTETYRERGQLHCEACDELVLPERPLLHGFSWKTGFYRGAILRISNRLYEQRKAQKQPAAEDAASIRALVVRTDQENDEYIRQHFGETRRGRARRAAYYASAVARGRRRGDDVSLAPTNALQSARNALRLGQEKS